MQKTLHPKTFTHCPWQDGFIFKWKASYVKPSDRKSHRGKGDRGMQDSVRPACVCQAFKLITLLPASSILKSAVWCGIDCDQRVTAAVALVSEEVLVAIHKCFPKATLKVGEAELSSFRSDVDWKLPSTVRGVSEGRSCGYWQWKRRFLSDCQATKAVGFYSRLKSL